MSTSCTVYTSGVVTHAKAVEGGMPTLASYVDYICEGPLLRLCHISPEDVKRDISLWLELGQTVANDLGVQLSDLDKAAKLRIFQYYLPVFFWCWRQVKEHQAAGAGRPLVIGMQAVQGCGKTTLVTELQVLFAKVGLTAASVSIDDFYLTFEDQQALIKANPDNFLLGVRGNALTHDLDLGRQTLASLQQLARGSSGSVTLPRYDKSAHQGRGDRADPATWPTVAAPLDVVLFEGWMLGFSPIPPAEAEQVSGDLIPINDRLAEYVNSWDSFVDAWLVIKVADPAYVFRWRKQAEDAMKAKGKPGMTDEQVQDFVNRYMPAYKAYLPGMYERGPSTGKKGKVLMFEIDESRGLSGST